MQVSHAVLLGTIPALGYELGEVLGTIAAFGYAIMAVAPETMSVFAALDLAGRIDLRRRPGPGGKLIRGGVVRIEMPRSEEMQDFPGASLFIQPLLFGRSWGWRPTATRFALRVEGRFRRPAGSPIEPAGEDGNPMKVDHLDLTERLGAVLDHLLSVRVALGKCVGLYLTYKVLPEAAKPRLLEHHLEVLSTVHDPALRERLAVEAAEALPSKLEFRAVVLQAREDAGEPVKRGVLPVGHMLALAHLFIESGGEAPSEGDVLQEFKRRLALRV